MNASAGGPLNNKIPVKLTSVNFETLAGFSRDGSAPINGNIGGVSGSSLTQQQYHTQHASFNNNSAASFNQANSAQSGMMLNALRQAFDSQSSNAPAEDRENLKCLHKTAAHGNSSYSSSLAASSSVGHTGQYINTEGGQLRRSGNEAGNTSLSNGHVQARFASSSKEKGASLGRNVGARPGPGMRPSSSEQYAQHNQQSRGYLSQNLNINPAQSSQQHAHANVHNPGTTSNQMPKHGNFGATAISSGSRRKFSQPNRPSSYQQPNNSNGANPSYVVTPRSADGSNIGRR